MWDPHSTTAAARLVAYPGEQHPIGSASVLPVAEQNKLQQKMALQTAALVHPDKYPSITTTAVDDRPLCQNIATA